MAYAQRHTGGWYAALHGTPRGFVRDVVYVLFVPELGPLASVGGGDFGPLSPEARAWEWHGPYVTPRAARAADLTDDVECGDPFED